MSIWQTVTWDLARAGGLTAFGLLTLSVVIGLALSLRWQTGRWPRIINSELHNFLTLLALIFTGVHILAVWVDPFTHFGWNEVLLPFASHYRPVWMALGIVAFYLGLAIGLSTWLRSRIGYLWWRRLHTLTLLLFGLVVVHGMATGSDTQTWWGMALYTSSVVLVGTLLWLRLRKPLTAKSRAHPVLAGALIVLIAVGTAWTLLGPLQPGWAALANGNASGSPLRASAPVGQSPLAFPHTFTGTLQGQYTRQGPDAHGLVTLHFTLHISNGSNGNVQVTLQGQSGGDDERTLVIASSQVVLLSQVGQPLFLGPVNAITGDEHLSMEASLTGTDSTSGEHLRVRIRVRLTTDGQVTGTITAGATLPDENTGSE